MDLAAGLRPADVQGAPVDETRSEEILAAMHRRLRSAIVCALLGFVAVAASAGVAKAAAKLDHACCPSAARDQAGDDAPCHGFLPLSCCDAAALPTGVHDTAAFAAPALPASLVPAPIDPDRAPLRAHVARAPRASPLRLSVVIQV